MMNNTKYFITAIYPSIEHANKFYIEWHSRLDSQFGCVSLIVETDKVIIDSEHKDREFVKSILNCMVDGAELIGEK